jgi:hypothetical protein
MWEYRGQNDCTFSTAVDWSEDEYRKVLAKATTPVFTSFDDGLQPFSEERPTPQVPDFFPLFFDRLHGVGGVDDMFPWLWRRDGRRSPTIFPHSRGRSLRR